MEQRQAHRGLARSFHRSHQLLWHHNSHRSGFVSAHRHPHSATFHHRPKTPDETGVEVQGIAADRSRPVVARALRSHRHAHAAQIFETHRRRHRATHERSSALDAFPRHHRIALGAKRTSCAPIADRFASKPFASITGARVWAGTTTAVTTATSSSETIAASSSAATPR